MPVKKLKRRAFSYLIIILSLKFQIELGIQNPNVYYRFNGIMYFKMSSITDHGFYRISSFPKSLIGMNLSKYIARDAWFTDISNPWVQSYIYIYTWTGLCFLLPILVLPFLFLPLHYIQNTHMSIYTYIYYIVDIQNINYLYTYNPSLSRSDFLFHVFI